MRRFTRTLDNTVDLGFAATAGPAVRHSVHDDHWGVERVTAPFLNVLLQTLIPPRVSIRILPAEVIEKGHIVSDDMQVRILGRFENGRQRGRACLAALGLKDLRERKRLDIKKTRRRVDVIVVLVQR